MTEPTYTKRRYLSVHSLIEFSRCPRLYFYSKSNLSPAEDFLAPIYGNAMHAAVPVALETGSLANSMSAFMSVWQEIEDAQEKGDEDPKRNRNTAQRSLQHFIHTHQGTKSLYRLLPPPAGTLETDEKNSTFEVPWAIDVGLPIPLVGRFDSFCQHRDTGDKWVLEIKTTSRLTSQFMEAHEMNPQNATYCLVAKTLLGEDVRGVMIEGMLVDKTKVDNMTQPIPSQPHHLEDILAWIRYTGGLLLACEERYLATGDVHAFLKDFTGCTPYPMFYTPGFRCDFADLCRVADWRSLTSLFRIRPAFDFLAPKSNGGTEVTIDPNATRKVIDPKPLVSSIGQPQVT